MSRKNKKRKVAHGHLVPVRLAMAIVVGGTLAISSLLLGHSCDVVGQEISKLEIESERLGQQLAKESNRWAEMTKPQNLERSLARHGLVMVYPRPDQVVRLKRIATGDVTPATAAPQYARLERTGRYE